MTADLQDGGLTIAVVARFRPQNKIEIASGGQPIVAFDSEDTCRIQVRCEDEMASSPSRNGTDNSIVGWRPGRIHLRSRLRHELAAT